jgi:hypothetical protein
MIDDTVNSNTFCLQIVIAQVFKQGIDNHRSQVKDQQPAGNPEKGLLYQLQVYIFGQYRFVKIAATKNHYIKRS